MLCIFNGYPTLDGKPLDALEIQTEIAAEICACEDNDICWTKLGCFEVTPAVAGETAQLLKEITDEVVISPSLIEAGLTMLDFPDGFSFGNGVSCNSEVPMKGGAVFNLSWTVFPLSEGDHIHSTYDTLLEIMETRE
jgi:hypothetical protein